LGGLVVGRHVSDRTVEYVFETREFSLSEAGTELPVECNRCRPQTKERLLARMRQLHYMNPSVGHVAATGDQPFGINACINACAIERGSLT
jgi:hypothetical protein